MSVVPESFRAALSDQLDDEFGPGFVPPGLRAAGDLLEFLRHRMPDKKFRVLLDSGWQQVRPRLEEAAHTYGYDDIVPALIPHAMLLCCSSGALADLAAGEQ